MGDFFFSFGVCSNSWFLKQCAVCWLPAIPKVLRGVLFTCGYLECTSSLWLEEFPLGHSRGWAYPGSVLERKCAKCRVAFLKSCVGSLNKRNLVTSVVSALEALSKGGLLT